MPLVDPNSIKVPSGRMRKLSQEHVDSLAQSMKDVGQIYPILVNRQTLIAGAHRLAAAKQLGLDEVRVENHGDPMLPDLLKLCEIDENLVRNELTPSERAEHIAVKAGILGKKFVDEVGVNPSKLEEMPPKVKVSATREKERQALAAKTAAEKKAKESIAADLGHTNTTHVTAEIKNHEAVTKANLDTGKLKGLNASQFKEVAKTAKKDKAEAARQLDRIEVANKGDTVISPKRLKNDSDDYVKEQIGIIVKAGAAIKRTMKILMSDKYAPHKSDNYLIKRGEDLNEDIKELAVIMREKFNVVTENK